MVLCCLFFFVKHNFIFGLVAGFGTGVLNFGAIVFSVKSIIKPGAASASAALASVVVYLAKTALIGGLIAVLVIYRKNYSIKGFLVGFTLTLVLLAAEAMLARFFNTNFKSIKETR